MAANNTIIGSCMLSETWYCSGFVSAVCGIVLIKIVAKAAATNKKHNNITNSSGNEKFPS
jgi:hypothetical protein